MSHFVIRHLNITGQAKAEGKIYFSFKSDATVTKGAATKFRTQAAAKKAADGLTAFHPYLYVEQVISLTEACIGTMNH